MADGIDAITIETRDGAATLSPEELEAMANGGLDGDSDAMRGARRLVEGLLDDVAGSPKGARQVEFRMAGEDFRAMLSRCLLFAATKDGLAAVRIEIAPYWATASAVDGYTLGVQRMRCEAEAEGIFALDVFDAQRMLQLIPRPRKEEQLGDVVVDFITGATGPVNMRYEGDDSRVVMYGCSAAPAEGLPDFRKLIEFDRSAPPSDPRFAVDPQFLAKVAKAELTAKDQIPLFVRWYLRPSKAFGENPLVMAHFSVEPTHDEFVAVLTPTGVEWASSNDLGAVVDRMGRLPSLESERLRPQQFSLEVD